MGSSETIDVNSVAPLSLPSPRLPTLTGGRGLRRRPRLTALIDNVLCDGVGFDQGFGARQFALRQVDLGVAVVELPLRLRGDGLVLPGIALVEKVAGLA